MTTGLGVSDQGGPGVLCQAKSWKEGIDLAILRSPWPQERARAHREREVGEIMAWQSSPAAAHMMANRLGDTFGRERFPIHLAYIHGRNSSYLASLEYSQAESLPSMVSCRTKWVRIVIEEENIFKCVVVYLRSDAVVRPLVAAVRRSR